MYKSCGKDGIISNKIGKKGVLLARRDNSKFIRNLYEQIIKQLFDGVDREEVLYYIIMELNKLCSNCFPYEDLVITKAVNDTNNLEPIPYIDEKGKEKIKIGSYKVDKLPKDAKERESQLEKKGAKTEKEYYSKSLPAQVQLAEKMRRRGQRVDVGSRIEYVITDIDNHKEKQYEKIEHIDYYKSHSDVLSIDFFYYMENAINPIDQLLDVAFADSSNYKYKFKAGFMESQYNFRYKIRKKVLDQIKELNKPKLVFK